MKQFFLLYCIFLTFHTCLQAASVPKWMKKANKSLVTLYAIQEKGDTLLANAFFINEKGDIVAPFNTIRNAREAWIHDYKGKRFEVNRILGFNSTYNAVRLQIEGNNKAIFIPTSSRPVLKGQTIFSLPDGEDEITEVEKANEYNYYTLKSLVNFEKAGYPVINEMGEVVGVLQTPILNEKAHNFVLDINFFLGLNVKAIDANHADLRNCKILKQMPKDEDQATSFLYLSSTCDSEMRLAYIEEFIQTYPQKSIGYTMKAQLLSEENKYKEAYQTFEEGIQKVEIGRDEIFYARSLSIYNMVLSKPSSTEEGWNMEQALTDIETAINVNNLPLYTQHKANILYTQKRYEEAGRLYLSLTNTSMRSPELFMYASQCLQKSSGDSTQVLALCDSAVACFTKPYPVSAAPYLLLRGQTYRDAGRLREAISDMNDYEHDSIDGKVLAVDNIMYKNKEEYYSLEGKDRRKTAAATID